MLRQDYNIAWMRTLVCGKKSNTTKWCGDNGDEYCHPEAEHNYCDVDGISNPDNVAMIPEHNQLLIGEDTGNHQNDMVWVYHFNVDEEERPRMTRIATTPYGAETTSPYWYPNLKNGHSYITLVVQHPYGESDKEKVSDSASSGEEGWVGYLGPLPKVSKVSLVNSAATAAPSLILSALVAMIFAVAACA